MNVSLKSRSLKQLVSNRALEATRNESQLDMRITNQKAFRIRDNSRKEQPIKSPQKQMIPMQINNLYYQRSSVKNLQKMPMVMNNYSGYRQMNNSQSGMMMVSSNPPSPKYQRKPSSFHTTNNNLKQSQVDSNTVHKQDFKFTYVIGKGGFGKVWKVEHIKTRKMYAMKEMSKAKYTQKLQLRVIQKRSVNSVLNERQLLKHLRHPYYFLKEARLLVNMHYAFSDRENLYLVMDLLQGGDLRYHLSKMKRFSETQTRFFVACILLPLTYLHRKGVIHRDLKPENLVLDEQGYMRLTDLGVARIDKGQNQNDTSGTPGYMAPEVMCRQEHSIQVDYYALGVIAHEMMLGKRPYHGRQRQEIREQMLIKQAQIKPEEVPIGWSGEAVDFINKLIQRKPKERLGANGPDEVLTHPWMKSFPYEKLLSKQITGSFIPGQVDGRQDFQSYISEETLLNEEQLAENKTLLRRNTVQQLFDAYYYIPDAQTSSQRKFTNSVPNSPAKGRELSNFE